MPSAYGRAALERALEGYDAAFQDTWHRLMEHGRRGVHVFGLDWFVESLTESRARRFLADISDACGGAAMPYLSEEKRLIALT